MSHENFDVIDPEQEELETYESHTKSGTHGEVFQKQLAQVLLLRMTREKIDFKLAYELAAADKFDDIGLYDRAAKRWILLQSKHADNSNSKIDMKGLIPTTNVEKGDLSLYKYFQSFLKIRKKFKGTVNLILFTNRQLDQTLLSGAEYLSFKDRKVDKALQFTSDTKPHKKLIPSKSTVKNLREHVNKEFISLKEAIKKLFNESVVTKELSKYKTYLHDILSVSTSSESAKYEIRFKATFNESLICIAELYKAFRNALEDMKAVDKPIEANFAITKDLVQNWPSVDSEEFALLKNAITNLFKNGSGSEILNQYASLLSLILTTDENQLKFKKTFNHDVICKAELYKALKSQLLDMDKVVETNQNIFDGIDPRIQPIPVFVDATDVEQFFEHFTLAEDQQVDLRSLIVSELYSWMRGWLRPEVFGKWSEDNEDMVVKALDDNFEDVNKKQATKRKKFLSNDFIEQFHNKLRTKIENLFVEQKASRLSYINRKVSFDRDRRNMHLLSGCSSEKADYEDKDDKTKHINKAREEMIDHQLAVSLKSRFRKYQCLFLTGDPGMGKTELLQYVALEYQKLNEGNVFLLYLNNLQFQTDFINCENLDILKLILSERSFFQLQKVLNKEINGHITMLFDGYDEVHSENRKKINKLFTLLLKSDNVQLVISGRKHVEHVLQKTFDKNNINSKTITLKPFSYQNIIDYLAKSWEENTCSPQFITYTKKLLGKLYSNMQLKDEALDIIPLLLKMISDIYKTRFQNFKANANHTAETDFQEFSEIEKIYESFIEKCLTPGGSCNQIGGFYLGHQIFAIEYLDIVELKGQLINPLYTKQRELFVDRCFKRSEKSVLIKIEGENLYFAHNLYAEYFVAKFLYDRFFCLQSEIFSILDKHVTVRRFVIKMIEHEFDFRNAEKTSFFKFDVIFWACECNAVRLLNYTMRKFLRYSIFKANYYKMFNIAVENGSDKICYELIDKHGINCNKTYEGLSPLHSAIIGGHSNVVELLLNNGASLDTQSKEGLLAIHYAVRDKHEAIFQQLVDRNINVNAPDRRKWTALHFACDNDDVKMVKKLIYYDAQLELKTNEDKTPLHLAATRGYLKVVELLLSNGANIDAMGEKSYITIQLALLNDNYYMMANMLLNKHSKFERQIGFEKTPLHNAAMRGQAKKVSELIVVCANVDALDEFIKTPLHWASQNGHGEVMQLLIENGANIDAFDSTHWTALHYAASNGHCSVMELLSNKGTNVNATIKDGSTPLHLACKNGHKNVVESLINIGANIDALDSEKLSALHHAASKGHHTVVQLLLDKNAEINATDHHGWTPLHLACLKGHKCIVETLLGRGANISACSSIKWTTLHQAASKGHSAVVELLLSKGANVNATDENGRTALHLACHYGHKDVVDVLLDKGANVVIDETSLDLACFNGRQDIVDSLFAMIDSINNTQ